MELVTMEQEVIDLSHLTEGEREKLVAVIDADEELRIRSLSLTGSNQSSSRNGGRNIDLQQLHLKLESDHRYGSELLRRSLIAVSEQRREDNGNKLPTLNSHSNVDLALHCQSVKVSLDDLPEVKEFEKDETNCLQKQNPTIIKSSSIGSLNSLSSMYSASAGKGDYDIKGKLEVGVYYKDGQLFVKVIRAKGLAAAKKGGVSNPYVKMYLLPDHGKHTKRKTGVQRKTTSPNFDETLKIKMELSYLSSQTLWLSVWDWDAFGRNHFLGEVYLPLSSLDLTQSKSYWYTLQDEDGSALHNDSNQGKLRVGLMYSPKVKLTSLNKKTTRIIGTLHIAIHQARDLPAMDENRLTDATVKIYLLPNQSSSGKYKTQVINHSLNPVWNEQFTYEHVYMDDLTSGRVLEVTVWDYDRRGSNDFIGGLRIGSHPYSVPHRLKDWMDSTGDEVTHWEAMLQRPGEWVEQWHSLRLSMEPASKYYAPPSPRSTHIHTVYEKVSTTTAVALLPGPNTTTPDTKELLQDGNKTRSTRSFYHKYIYDITGEVLMGVYYKNNQLHIHVDRARGLAAADSNGYSDPYIKVYLLPKSAKQKTSTKKKTLDPIYNETLMFNLSESEVISQTLSLSVWDWDLFGSNDFLGEFHIPLSSINLKDTRDHWYKLKDRDSMSQIALQSSNDIDHAIPGDVSEDTEAAGLNSEAGNSASTNSGQYSEKPEYENDHSIRLSSAGDYNEIVQPAGEEPQQQLPSDKGNLQRTNSTSESSINTSEYSTAAAGKGDYSITGKVEIEMWYKDGQLFVHVVRAKDLAATKADGVSNPYVKIYLLSDRGRHSKWKTGVQQNTRNPFFNEILKMKIEQHELTSRTLLLTVWDWDRYDKKQLLGQARLPLASLDHLPLTSIDLKEDDCTLQHDSHKGKLRVGLMYAPQAKVSSSSKNTTRTIGTLHIAIHQAEDLPVMDEHRLTDATVKMYLLPNQSSLDKCKTQVIEHSLNPAWNEQFAYENIYMDDLSSGRALEVTVWDYDGWGSNEFIGGLRIGPNPDSMPHRLKDWMDSTGDEVTHWEAMLQRPGEWVEQWHSLHAMKVSSTGIKSTIPDVTKRSSFTLPSSTSLPHDQLIISHSSKPADSVGPDELSRKETDDESIVSRVRESDENQSLQKVKEAAPLYYGGHLDSTSSLYKKTAYDITGEVLVGVYYKNNQLHIHVDRARGLAAADSNGYSDPYVKTYLLPDRAKYTKKKTRVKKKTLDPIYNETLKYKVSKSDLVSRILWLSVWDWDRFSKNQFLGEIYLSLSSLDLSNVINHWYKLQDKDDDSHLDLFSGSTTSLQRSHLTGTATYTPEAVESTIGNQHSVTVDVEEDLYQPEAAMNSTHVEMSSNLSKSLSSLGSTSVYSEAGGKGTYDITGEVLMGVYYKNNQLHIHVDRARGLAAADNNGYSNPYIKAYLLPDRTKHTKQKTTVKKRTLDPVYGEELLYDLSESELSSRTLMLTVWDWNRFGNNHFLGEVRLSLSSLDLTVSHSHQDSLDQWYMLQDEEEAIAGEVGAEYRGELKVGLNYSPNSGSQPMGTLVINVKQAKELPVLNGNTTDSVVKLYLLPNQKSSGKRKTSVIKNNINPVWEEKFTYEDISLEELSYERVLEISMWNYDNGSHMFIGGVRIGPAPGSAAKHKDWMDSIGDEVTHWEDMLARPGEWVEQWHILRTTLIPRDELDLYTYFSINSES